MAKSNLDKLVDNPKKILIIVIIVVIVAVVVWIMWSRISRLIAQLTGKIQDNAELNNHITQTGETLSFSDTEYRNMANKLEEAFYGSWLFGAGTDENAVYAVFNRLNNKADLLKLVAAYGTDKNSRTLNQALQSELTNSELAHVNNILTNKGIYYQF